MSREVYGVKEAVGDPNKPRLSLIPRTALWLLGKALSYGEGHYGAHSFKESGVTVSYYIDGALRHLYQFLDGEDYDEKSKCHHLGSAMANICMAIDILTKCPKLDDRFKGEYKDVPKS